MIKKLKGWFKKRTTNDYEYFEDIMEGMDEEDKV